MHSGIVPHHAFRHGATSCICSMVPHHAFAAWCHIMHSGLVPHHAFRHGATSCIAAWCYIMHFGMVPHRFDDDHIRPFQPFRTTSKACVRRKVPSTDRGLLLLTSRPHMPRIQRGMGPFELTLPPPMCSAPAPPSFIHGCCRAHPMLQPENGLRRTNGQSTS